jgi:hypothetical protein
MPVTVPLMSDGVQFGGEEIVAGTIRRRRWLVWRLTAKRWRTGRQIRRKWTRAEWDQFDRDVEDIRGGRALPLVKHGGLAELREPAPGRGHARPKVCSFKLDADLQIPVRTVERPRAYGFPTVSPARGGADSRSGARRISGRGRARVGSEL